MAEEGGPDKLEMQEFFRRLRNISANRSCFDCNSKNPTWASVTYGVFICIDCSAVHRSLGVHLSFVRSTQLDTNWTWTQLRNMQLGGNGNASAFFSQHNCTTSDAQQKYNSRAAHLYREKLNQTVAKYNKIHGNKIIFDPDEHAKTTDEKDADFFKDMHSVESSLESLGIDNSARLTKKSQNGSSSTEPAEGPNVLAALSSPSQDQTATSILPKKSTIGQRKPASKLGAKKVGMGAQKLKTDFSEIEKEAEMLDKLKEKQVEDARAASEQRTINDEKQMASARLVYQDLAKQTAAREEQLKHMDPKKAEQVERLGMGVGVRAGVSHSAIFDMKTIDQEIPASNTRTSKPRKEDSFFDDYEVVENSSFYNTDGAFLPKKNLPWGDFEKPNRSVSSSDESTSPVKKNPTSKSGISPSRRNEAATSRIAIQDDAQKKFGNAKGISSEQFFSGSSDNNFERQANLARFEGQSSISSADYFGDGHQRNQQQSGFQNSLQNVDMDDVKESVRQGVTKVAGRLSNLATGVMSSLQEKYGY